MRETIILPGWKYEELLAKITMMERVLRILGREYLERQPRVFAPLSPTEGEVLKLILSEDASAEPSR